MKHTRRVTCFIIFQCRICLNCSIRIMYVNSHSYLTFFLWQYWLKHIYFFMRYMFHSLIVHYEFIKRLKRRNDFISFNDHWYFIHFINIQRIKRFNAFKNSCLNLCIRRTMIEILYIILFLIFILNNRSCHFVKYVHIFQIINDQRIAIFFYISLINSQTNSSWIYFLFRLTFHNISFCLFWIQIWYETRENRHDCSLWQMCCFYWWIFYIQIDFFWRVSFLIVSLIKKNSILKYYIISKIFLFRVHCCFLH